MASDVVVPILRDYQSRGLEAIRDAFRRGVRAVMAVAPTGSGKTVMIAAIVLQAIARGGRVVIVVHRRELVRQTVRQLRRFGIESVRVLVGGVATGPPDAPVVVAAIQTLTGRSWRNRLPPASLVIWDECHHIKAKSFLLVREAYGDAFHIGLTATPVRSDRSPLGDVFFEMIVIATIRGLTEEGHLVPCDVWAPATGRNALAADPVDAYVQHGEGKRAIVFCANVVHSKDVAGRLRAVDVAAEHVDGAMPARERDAALARFECGETHVVTNCNLVTEGFDVPAAKCVVLARGCNSVAMFLQAVGRALRPDSAGDRALLLDLRGAVHRHGLPDDDREFSLHGEAIRGSDPVDSVKQCRSCGAVYRPRPVCPRCGEASPLPKAPAVRPERLLQIARKHTPEQRRRHFDELRTIAARRGYKPGWAYHKFVGFYGQKPEALA